VLPELRAQDLLDRYRRVRQARRFAGKAPKNVFVLSRVTLGADVAITSQALDAAKRAFPHAAIWFVGPPKNWEMFAADPRLRHIPVAYGRDGLLQARLAVWPALRDALAQPGVVIDPDSRLTQLGLLPVCEEENYYFFESRAYGEYGHESLVALTRRWLGESFGVPDSRPYIAPSAQGPAAEITVSFGAGDNPAKRVADPFELEMLRLAASRGRVLLDEGAGGEETERAQQYVQALGVERGAERSRRLRRRSPRAACTSGMTRRGSTWPLLAARRWCRCSAASRASACSLAGGPRARGRSKWCGRPMPIPARC